MRTSLLIYLTLLLILCLFSGKADAAMKFCNRTPHPVQAAFGYRDNGGWVSEGWWHLDAAQCAEVADKPLTQRFYFYYGISLAPVEGNKLPTVWSGKYELCIDTKAFHIDGDGDCESRHFHTQGFQEIDIGSTARDYTLDFKE